MDEKELTSRVYNEMLKDLKKELNLCQKELINYYKLTKMRELYNTCKTDIRIDRTYYSRKLAEVNEEQRPLDVYEMKNNIKLLEEQISTLKEIMKNEEIQIIEDDYKYLIIQFNEDNEMKISYSQEI